MRIQTRQQDHPVIPSASKRQEAFFSSAARPTAFFSKGNSTARESENTGYPFFSAAGTDIKSFNQHARSNGKPLDRETKKTMETGFAADFSAVKIHDDEKAASLANEFNANAFTVGQDIYFSKNAYQPRTNTGKKLLAHELTHSLQGVNYIARNRRAPGPTNHCGQTNNISSLQHLIIQLWYQFWQPPLLREYEMPADMSPGSYYPQRTEGGWGDLEEELGRAEVERLSSGNYTINLADLVDPASHHMWEIMHPSDDPIQKRIQLNGYINRANFHCGSPQFQPGERLPIQYIPSPERPLLIVTPILGGLLQYRYGPEIERVPAVRRDRILERLLDSIRNRYTFIMPEELLSPAPAEQAVPVQSGLPAADPEAAAAARRRLAVAAGVTVTGVAAAVIRRAAWRHFWRVVAQRFAARGAAAVLLSAADGPLPFGELASVGIGLVTVIQIINDWNNLWQSAEVNAQNEG